MKKSIVFKWFVITALLFSTMFLFIGIAQNYFFEKYYINKKSDTLKMYMNQYSDMAVKKGAEAASVELYNKDHVWITKLDKYGRICNVENYYIEVKLKNESQSNLRIPMYSFEGEFSSDVLSLLKVGDEVSIDTVNIENEKIPYLIQTDSTGVVNLNIANKLHGPHADKAYSHLVTGMCRGKITKTVFPKQDSHITFPYYERYFLDQVKEFQTDLLIGNGGNSQYIEKLSTTENFGEYKIIIKPIIEDGVTRYIFAMTSLQPVDEAISAIRQFYPYFFGFTLLCVILLAFVFSKWLSKPLLSINQITGKIANMDFTEKLPVRSQDEIGQLSRNINYLSSQMEAHISQLEKDLDKEKQLENTRKEFIAGVSHELKTPLAVMKSCLSILKDGIAVEKREHYFQAMEEEIEQMNLLVVNMLDLAKFESGTYKPKMTPFEIDKVITHVCRSLAEQIQEKNLSLILRLSSQRVLGHKGLINRVITNFLSNAIRHTENGHSIVIAVRCNGQTAEISIENQGNPILEEDRKKIWNQFYRVEARTSKVGTGLGLSISKEILELHHSIYGVENTKDGVRFFFSLPIQS
ncbi:TPA: HAMP domain-containing histidine kinase [Clostridium botulinum]|uniref:sensor histidine kinase n=1 Tax=Clostridium botulinum TaxID=1491 RepID=UPI000D0D2A38|nr:HAMP domain-containing sensor histidine kinase [Clostridium botulinum]PSM00906.1 sensor histidine kinase [Clostridium botulinum]HDK7163660.1 HAMP domain-containing histidine kinase [Clostridium botulinum]HDK7171135.1 HAMP domain-containing histidine kinase [Clostridium botulinum]HDK7182188.1 HAMP domain-containing histidine kinase [Clostridium botulinum]HDK7185908.1 HAMP domain-containing histidine kinase [Clostridium botulinum]